MVLTALILASRGSGGRAPDREMCQLGGGLGAEPPIGKFSDWVWGQSPWVRKVFWFLQSPTRQVGMRGGPRVVWETWQLGWGGVKIFFSVVFVVNCAFRMCLFVRSCPQC